MAVAVVVHAVILALPTPGGEREQPSSTDEVSFVLLEPREERAPNTEETEPEDDPPAGVEPPPPHVPRPAPKPSPVLEEPAPEPFEQPLQEIEEPPKPPPSPCREPVVPALIEPSTSRDAPEAAEAEAVEFEEAERPPLKTAFGEPEGPRFKERIAPEYPRRARRMHREGVVTLELQIDADGRLTEARVLESAGYGMEEAALKAVQNSTFEPASQGGMPVPSRATLNIRFRLQ